MNIGINGMGRIGRAILKQAIINNLEIVAINDANMTPQELAYLLKYDSTLQRLNLFVDVADDEIYIDNRRIFFLRESEPANIVWGQYDVQYVFECTGKYTTTESASAHLQGGASKVIICSPSTDAPIFIQGVNESKYNNSLQIISMGSCSSHAGAVILNLLNYNIGINSAVVKVVRAYTNDQSVMDNANSTYPERGRACAMNIIPTHTDANKVIGKVIPELNKSLLAQAFRTPTILGGVIDITFTTDKAYTASEINETLEQHVKKLTGILDYTKEPLVSSDVIGNTNSVVVLGRYTTAIGNGMFNVVGLYDNENAFAKRCVEMAQYMNSME